MPLVSGGVPTRQRGAPKRPAVLGWVAAVFGRFLQFAVEPGFLHRLVKIAFELTEFAGSIGIELLLGLGHRLLMRDMTLADKRLGANTLDLIVQFRSLARMSRIRCNSSLK